MLHELSLLVAFSLLLLAQWPYLTWGSVVLGAVQSMTGGSSFQSKWMWLVCKDGILVFSVTASSYSLL